MTAYQTLDSEYVESVWWALRTIHDRGLLFEKLKVVPYCTRCGTALSSHELGQPGVYQDDVDLSAYVRLRVRTPVGPLHEGDELVVWTTTPWTLVSNAAVAVDGEMTYVRARPAGGAGRGGSELAPGTVLVVAKALLERVLGPTAEVLEEFPGEAIVGTGYEPPFPYIATGEYGPSGFLKK